VKNEWSRYLALIKQGEKKMLVPAYRDMDPYDLPQEFSHLQAQDMSKLGFMQDLIRGIVKIVNADKVKYTDTREISTDSATNESNPLLERAFIFIEDGDFETGDEYCEKVLDQDPKCAEAYLGKLMADLRVNKRSQLAYARKSFQDNVNYKRIVRFGSPALIEEVSKYLDQVKAWEASQENERIKAEALRKTQREEVTRKKAQSPTPEEIYISSVIARYNDIPSNFQITEQVKNSDPINKLKTWAIIFLILYWPVGLILFAVRHFKIKTAIENENAKYDGIRREYNLLKSSGKIR
jgi:hypothetical protein